LYRDVSSLIKDAAWLKHYVASAMCIESEALGLAHSAFGKIALDQDNTASAAASRPASVVTASQDAPNLGTNPSSLSPTGSTSSGGGGAPQTQPPAPMAAGESRTISSASTGQMRASGGGLPPPTNNPYVH
jgi:hypothetical protein